MAGTNVGSIEYDARINTSKFASDASDVDGKAKGLAGSIGGGLMKATKVAALGFAAAGAAATVFGKKSVDAYNESVVAGTKLRTNMLNVKGATDKNVESLKELASQLQNVGVIEDDVIVAGMSQLATFNLQGKTIETLTPKITDMVAQLKGHNATSEDMVGINNLVGKVMTGNVGALSRYGVTLDENQSKVLKNGTESEKAAMLVKVLGQNYGKVNEELRKTPEGRITALKNTFGEFQEKVGEVIMKAIVPLIAGFDDWIQRMGGVDGIFERIGNVVKSIVSFFRDTFIPTLQGVWAWFNNLNPVVQAMISPVGFLIANFTAVMNVIKQVGEIIMTWFWPSLKALGNTIMTQLVPSLLEIWKSVVRLWDALNPGLMKAIKVIAIILGVTLVAIIWVVINVINVLAKVLGFIAKAIAVVVGWISNLIKWLGNAIMWFSRFIRDSYRAFNALQDVVQDAVKGAAKWLYNTGKEIIQGLINGIKDMFNSVKSTLGDLTNRLTDWKGPMSLDKKILQKSGQAVIGGFITGLESQYGAVQSSLNGLTGSISGDVNSNVTGSAGMQSINSINGSSTPSATTNGGVSVNVNMAGIMARSKTDLRDITKDMLRAVNEELRAKQVDPIGGGAI